MSPRTRWILIGLAVLMAVTLGVVGISYYTGRQAAGGPVKGLPPPPSQDQIMQSPKTGRYDLGEFVATSRDEDLHYIKIVVEVEYIGNIEKELEERRGELRDAITTILMKLTTARAKEDYIDHFLHKVIERELNNKLGRGKSER